MENCSEGDTETTLPPPPATAQATDVLCAVWVGAVSRGCIAICTKFSLNLAKLGLRSQFQGVTTPLNENLVKLQYDRRQKKGSTDFCPFIGALVCSPFLRRLICVSVAKFTFSEIAQRKKGAPNQFFLISHIGYHNFPIWSTAVIWYFVVACAISTPPPQSWGAQLEGDYFRFFRFGFCPISRDNAYIIVVWTLSWFSCFCTLCRSPCLSYCSTAYSFRRLCGLTFKPLTRCADAHRARSFHTACRVLCSRGLLRLGNTYSLPLCQYMADKSTFLNRTVFFFPVFCSVTTSHPLFCRALCISAVFKAHTSSIRSPVFIATVQISLFVGVIPAIISVAVFLSK